jgi:serine/threonine protein kinase
LDQNEAQLYVGQIFAGRYRLDVFRGTGAFCGVFEGVDLTTQTPVAIKVLSLAASQNAGAVFEFHEESRLLKLLSECSNVVGIFDQGQHVVPIQITGSPVSVPMSVSFIVLELATASLEKLLTSRHAIGWLDRLHLFRDVVKGTHQMHLARIVHRDLKAENILIFETRPPSAKVSDLGRSKNTAEPQHAPIQAYAAGRGDPRFMPPELLWQLGEPNPQAHLEEDLYLLGSVLFEFATGVGVTGFALGNPRSIVQEALSHPASARAAAYDAKVSDLRDQYDIAYSAFFLELPSSIAFEGTALLKQLTDPDPARRLPSHPFRKLPVAWDLQWLLRRIDILIKRLDVAERPPKFHRPRKRR